jgi:putative intracellular protease/amidase
MRLTASALPRAAVCHGSVVLPQADTLNEHSEAGSDSHAKAEQAVTQGRLEDLPEEVAALIPLGALVFAEVAVAYDLRTDRARVLGLGMRRAYEVGPTEIAGTIDLQISVDGARATVVDYKRWEDVGAPDENEQTMFYGLVTARLFELPEVTLAVAYVDQDEHGDLVLLRPLVTRVVDELDLDAFAQRLRWIAGRVSEQEGRPVPDVRESKHCKWCSAAAACPAKQSLVRRIFTGDERERLDALMPLNEETAAIAWERVAQAQNMLARITRALYAFAAERPFKLENGNIVG